jgi:threonine dehydratase
LLVEGGGAVGVSALLTAKFAPATSGSTCIVLSGGNVDIGLLPNLVRRHETKSGRRLNVFVRLPDRPGALAGFLEILALNDANIVEVQHVREGVELHARETGVHVVLEVKDQEHGRAVIVATREQGFNISNIVFP